MMHKLQTKGEKKTTLGTLTTLKINSEPSCNLQPPKEEKKEKKVVKPLTSKKLRTRKQHNAIQNKKKFQKTTF